METASLSPSPSMLARNVAARIKLVGLVVVLILANSASTRAQGRSGGFGNFFIGGADNICTSLQDDLRANALLGSSAKTNTITLLIGGSGYSVRPRGFVLGGTGFFYNITTTTDRGSSKLSVAGGFFDVGYAVVRNESILGFPYFGMGGIGATVKLTNSTSDKMAFGEDPIDPGRSAAYSSGGLAFETGFAFKFVIDNFSERQESNSRVGVVLGLDGGAIVFPSFSKWQNTVSDLEIAAYAKPFFITPYLRATIGMSILSP